jgi:hypothetical protein
MRSLEARDEARRIGPDRERLIRSCGHSLDNRGRQCSNSSLFVISSLVASFAFSKEHGSHDL